MKRAFLVILLAGLMIGHDGFATRRAEARRQSAAAVAVAFTNVSVVSMESNRVLNNQTVVVTNDRITAIGPAGSTRVPDGATRIEGKGKFLMPGLAEMHGHIPNPAQAPKDYIDDVLFLYVANGITTVRGMQGIIGQLELREASKRGDIIAPALYLAGPAFNGNSVKSADDAIARVKQQKADGWDLLKVLGGLSVEAYDAMARTAKESGIRFAGHVPVAVGVPHALEMGQDTIDHIDQYAEHLGGEAKPVDEKGIHDLVARTKKAGTAIVPTLYVWETLRGPVSLESRTSLPELRYLPSNVLDPWVKSLTSRLNNPQYNAQSAKLYIDNRMRIMKALYAGGVSILLGSDAPQQFNVPGFSIHHEMKRMQDAGMSAFDVLKSGTVSVGQYFKGQDDFGTIAAGKRADLILVDANPLQSLDNVAKRSGVMIRGRWLPESEIQVRLKQIAGRSTTSSAQSDWTPLWNGKSLDGWTTWMRQPEPASDVPGLARGADGRYTEPIGTGRDPLKVFTVAPDVDGMPAIRISGEAFGELRTARSFENYHLKLQFKWGEKKWPPRERPEHKRDSGLLYHVHAAPGQDGRTWARSIELQIQEGDVGDLYAVGSTIAVRATARAGTKPALFDYDPAGEWMFFSQSHRQDGRCIKQPDNEKPTGEWNTVELIAFGEEAIHIVNGRVVMRLRNPMRIDGEVPAPVTSGQIILQSEGAEVFYRDIQLRSIKAIPAEFAAK